MGNMESSLKSPSGGGHGSRARNPPWDTSIHNLHGRPFRMVKYACRYCLKKFRDKEPAKIHMRTCSERKTAETRNSSYNNEEEHEVVGGQVRMNMYGTSNQERSSTNDEAGQASGGGGENRSKTCSYCGKIFTRWENRLIHERVHTGEKPYACKYCPYKAAWITNMRVHENRCAQKNRPKMNRTVRFTTDPVDDDDDTPPTLIPQVPLKTEKRVIENQEITEIDDEDESVETEGAPADSHQDQGPVPPTVSTAVPETEDDRVKSKKCRYCGKIFSAVNSRIWHEYAHQNIKPFGCRYCSYRCCYPGNVAHHEQSCKEKKPEERGPRNLNWVKIPRINNNNNVPQFEPNGSVSQDGAGNQNFVGHHVGIIAGAVTGSEIQDGMMMRTNASSNGGGGVKRGRFACRHCPKYFSTPKGKSVHESWHTMRRN